MTCRALRLVMYGFVGASIAGSAAVAQAGELTPGQFQFQTIAIPKRIDLAAKPGDRLQPTDAALSGPPAPARTPLSSPLLPLSGLSLNSTSLSAPSTASSSVGDDKPAVTQQ